MVDENLSDMNLNGFDPNISPKKPMIRAESVWYGIVPFVVLLLLPTKVMRIKRAVGNAKKYADYA